MSVFFEQELASCDPSETQAVLQVGATGHVVCCEIRHPMRATPVSVMLTPSLAAQLADAIVAAGKHAAKG